MDDILVSLHAAVECASSNAVQRAEIYLLLAAQQEACALSTFARAVPPFVHLFVHLSALRYGPAVAQRAAMGQDTAPG